MQLSNDTLALLDLLDEHSKNNLRKRGDVGVIFELAASFNLVESINKIVFTGTALWNLYNVVKKSTADSEGIHLVQKEMENHIDAFREELHTILSYTGENQTIKRFHDIYFQMTKGCVLNMLDLAHDFSVFKHLQTKSKRG
jgi:hypothetical protein